MVAFHFKANLLFWRRRFAAGMVAGKDNFCLRELCKPRQFSHFSLYWSYKDTVRNTVGIMIIIIIFRYADIITDSSDLHTYIGVQFLY